MPGPNLAPAEMGAVMPAVSVLVINYEGGDTLRSCLVALTAQTMVDFEAIIIDNGSVDGSFERARQSVAGDPRFRFERPGRNLGFAAGNNQAARLATAPWLATLNPDAIADPDWLQQLMAATRRHPYAAMFGSTQLDASCDTRLDGAGDQYFFAGLAWRGGWGWDVQALPPEGEVFAPCAAAALYRRDAFEAAQGFDERFFCYVEDVDLAFRLRLAGHCCIQVPDAVVRHIGGVSSTAISGFARFHGTRNMVWCFVKNMPSYLIFLLLPFHLAAMAMVAAKSAIKGDLAAARGVVAALSCLPLAERRRVQAHRQASILSICRAMEWRPWVYMRRQPVVIRRV